MAMEMGGDVALQLLREFRDFRQEMGVHNERTHERLSTVEQGLVGIEQRGSTLQEDVSILKGSVSTLQEDVSALKGSVSTLQADVAGLKESVAMSLKNTTEILKTSAMTVQKLEALDQTVRAHQKHNHTEFERAFSALTTLARLQDTQGRQLANHEHRIGLLEKS